MEKIVKSFVKGKKGITLIALVITIIVLLILAGVTIASLMGENSILNQSTEAKIMTNLSKVDEAIKLYKNAKKIDKVVAEGSNVEVTNDDLIKDGVLKEYVIEETLRTIAVVENYDKLGISKKFGEGYSNIISYEISGENAPYIATLSELNNVCAIDLIDETLYYLENGKVWSIGGKTDIANNYERVNAENEEWTFNKNTKTLTAYNYKDKLAEVRGTQKAGEVIVPNYYEGTRVSGIGANVFISNTDLTNITISNGIQTIGLWAFKNCTSLTGDLIIPDSVTSIGQGAFEGCNSLDGTLKLSTNLESIGHSTFRDCLNLKGTITLSGSVKEIANLAFLNCSSLEGLIIEEGCSASISDGSWSVPGTFGNCTGLKGNLIIPSTFGNIGDYAFYKCTGLDGKIEIKGNTAKIGSYAFYNCAGLKGNLIIPDSVISIGQNAFEGCTSLDGTLKLSTNLESIGNSAFRDCSNLKGTITLSSSVKEIANLAFLNCSSLEGLIIEEGCSASIPDGNWAVPGTFGNCTGLKGNLIIPSTFGDIGGYAFYNCTGLDGNLEIKGNPTKIGLNAFYNCAGLKGDLIIPDSVTSIEQGAFEGCTSLDGTLKLSTNLESIGNSAFRDCSNLKGTITLSSSVKEIANLAFLNCSSLEGLIIEEGCSASIPDGGWAAPGTFGNCTGLTGDLIIPSTFGNIGNYAFYNCSKLSQIIIKNKDCVIGDLEATIPTGVKILGYADSTAQAYATKYNRTFEEI